MKLSKNQKKATLIVTAAGVALAAAGGTLAQFTASATSDAQTIESGIVSLDLVNATTAGASFVTPINNASPGDTFVKTLDVVNDGTIAWNNLTVDFTDGALPATLLTSDLDGFHVTITSAADSTPATPLVADAPLSTLIAGAPIVLGLDANDLEAADSTTLTFTYTFDEDATNDSSVGGKDFSGLTDDIAFKFDVTQRVPGTFVEASPTGSVDGIAPLS